MQLADIMWKTLNIEWMILEWIEAENNQAPATEIFNTFK